MDRALDTCSNDYEWVDFLALHFNCGYKGVIFVLFCFDGLVCIYVMCECKFYYLDG